MPQSKNDLHMFIVFALAIVAMVTVPLMPGCASSPTAEVRLIKTSKDVNLGHSKDSSLPPEARAIGQDNYDAFCALDYAMTGTPMPPEVRKRLGLTKKPTKKE